MRRSGKRAVKASAVFVAAATALCAALALGVGGCGGVGCGAVEYPAVEVLVFDAETGAPAAQGSTGTLRDGDYTERMRENRFEYARPEDPGSLPATALTGADGRRGTYTVRIEKPGYEPWERRSVRSTSDACGVTTTQLRADLRPLRP